MNSWTQAIYDITGIPLSDEDLAIEFRDGQRWLVVHDYPVWPLEADARPFQTVTPAFRTALAAAMTQRLSSIIPRVQRWLVGQNATQAQHVTVAVVYMEENDGPQLDDSDAQRGWPHFVLRLSTGGFDVEVDLNPYMPDDPFDWPEVHRQASVILQVVPSS